MRLTGDQDGSSLAPGEAVGLFEDVDDGTHKEAVATGRVVRIKWSVRMFLKNAGDNSGLQDHSPGESDPESERGDDGFGKLPGDKHCQPMPIWFLSIVSHVRDRSTAWNKKP